MGDAPGARRRAPAPWSWRSRSTTRACAGATVPRTGATTRRIERAAELLRATSASSATPGATLRPAASGGPPATSRRCLGSSRFAAGRPRARSHRDSRVVEERRSPDRTSLVIGWAISRTARWLGAGGRASREHNIFSGCRTRTTWGRARPRGPRGGGEACSRRPSRRRRPHACERASLLSRPGPRRGLAAGDAARRAHAQRRSIWPGPTARAAGRRGRCARWATLRCRRRPRARAGVLTTRACSHANSGMRRWRPRALGAAGWPPRPQPETRLPRRRRGRGAAQAPMAWWAARAEPALTSG